MKGMLMGRLCLQNKLVITGGFIAIIVIGCSKKNTVSTPPPNSGTDTGANGNPSLSHGYFADSNFKPTGTFITLAAVQQDGKIIIANPSGIGRINKDGSKDNSFTVASCDGGEIHSLALQDNGKILIGGSFLLVNGTATNYLARLNADGSQDMSMNGNSIYDDAIIQEDIKTLAVQKDGKIIVGGSFAWKTGPQVQGVTPHQANLIRLNADGTFDPSLKPYTANYGEYTSNVTNVKILDNGKMIVCGSGFSIVDGAGKSYYNIARLNADASVDTSFRWNGTSLVMSYSGTPSGPIGYGQAIGVQSNGNILMGGKFNMIGNIAYNGLVRMGSTGIIDQAFNKYAYQ